jgi:threonine/homoserine/homoserine lactone efflux protein
MALPTTILPSSFKIYLVSRSLAIGWRPTLPAIFTPLISDVLIIVVTLFLLSQIPTNFLHILRILGGLFILYIASRVIRFWRLEGPVLEASEQAGRQSFWQALVINFLNPNPYLFWGIVGGPIVLSGIQDYSMAVGLSFIIGFYAAYVVGLAALVWIFGTVGTLNPKLNKILSGIAAVALVALGLLQIIIGFRALINV